MDKSTSLHYWLRWEVATCCVSILASLGASIYLLCWYSSQSPQHDPKADAGEAIKESHGGVVYDEDAWRPYLKKLHPRWLLMYRALAFLLFGVLTANIICFRRYDIISYYTEWTFVLVTIYFGLATSLSIRGCVKFADYNGSNGEESGKKVAGFWGYLLQIIYQTSAGSVMMTDWLYWCALFPVLVKTPNGVDFLSVVMHSFNGVALIGDASLNSSKFPLFRMAYFFIWTSLYVVSQWIMHASVETKWPYPFLDLSSRLAPLWYILVGLLQIPCYLVFALLLRVCLVVLWLI